MLKQVVSIKVMKEKGNEDKLFWVRLTVGGYTIKLANNIIHIDSFRCNRLLEAKRAQRSQNFCMASPPQF